MRKKNWLATASLVLLVIYASVGYSYKVGEKQQAVDVLDHAKQLVGQLDSSQKEVAMLPADSPLQVGWHFIPKDERKGLELNKMTEAQYRRID